MTDRLQNADAGSNLLLIKKKDMIKMHWIENIDEVMCQIVNCLKCSQCLMMCPFSHVLLSDFSQAYYLTT